MPPSSLIGVSNFGVVVLLALSACTQGHSHPPTSSPELTHEATVVTEVESWSPQITSGAYQYFLRDSSTVSINNDTSTRVLPIETTMIYSVIITPSVDSFLISGKVDSSTINSRLQTKVASRDSAKSDNFHGVLSKQGGLISSSKFHPESCLRSSNAAASRIYELILPHPEDRIKIGDKWTDTISSTNCHGRTPLIQQIIRKFEVKEFTTWHQQKAVEVRRVVAITFIGTSTETNTHLSASGSGFGEATLLIDRSTAALLESNSHTRSIFTIVTSRGEFPFTQLTSTYITRK